MNKAFLIFALAFIIIDSQAQTASDSISRRGQAVFVELLGPGGIFSANYDTRFTSKPGGIGIRTGISYTKIEDASIFTLPVQMNYLLGKDEKYFEIGLGATYGSARILDSDSDDDHDSGSEILGTMTFGYRKQPKDGGFMFRGGIAPLFGKDFFWPYWPYISFGYSF